MRRAALVLCLALAFVGPAHAGANPKPVADDAAKLAPEPVAPLDMTKFSKEQVRTRFKDACMYRRAVHATQPEEISPGCNCYADKLIKGFTEAELDSWKATRKFDKAMEAKAEAAFGECVK